MRSRWNSAQPGRHHVRDVDVAGAPVGALVHRRPAAGHPVLVADRRLVAGRDHGDGALLAAGPPRRTVSATGLPANPASSGPGPSGADRPAVHRDEHVAVADAGTRPRAAASGRRAPTTRPAAPGRAPSRPRRCAGDRRRGRPRPDPSAARAARSARRRARRRARRSSPTAPRTGRCAWRCGRSAAGSARARRPSRRRPCPRSRSGRASAATSRSSSAATAPAARTAPARGRGRPRPAPSRAPPCCGSGRTWWSAGPTRSVSPSRTTMRLPSPLGRYQSSASTIVRASRSAKSHRVSAGRGGLAPSGRPAPITPVIGLVSHSRPPSTARSSLSSPTGTGTTTARSARPSRSTRTAAGALSAPLVTVGVGRLRRPACREPGPRPRGRTATGCRRRAG